jgi:hypothetical protein
MWIAVSFHLGFPCHRYIRRYLRYRRWPTRFAPPQPQEYPAVRVSIFAHNQIAASTTRFDQAAFLAASDGRIQIGPNAVSADIGGAIHLQCRGTDLIFRPRYSQKPVEFISASSHHWVVADGLCDVSGTVEVGSATAAFSGSGFHDQHYGTTPILHPCVGGCLFLKDRVIAFGQIDAMRVATGETNSLANELDTAIGPPWGHALWGLRYPLAIRLKEELLLAHPRILGSTPLGAWLEYEANWQGEKGVALCEVIAPQRLALPLLGGLFELGLPQDRKTGD